MRYLVLAGLAVLAPAGTLHAQTMPVSQFLQKADALQKKGAMALLSSDVGLLKKEVQNAGKALRAEQIAAQKGGRKPASCMPEKVSVGTSELLGHLRSIPPAQRSMSIKTAFAGLMNKKYPCPS